MVLDSSYCVKTQQNLVDAIDLDRQYLYSSAAVVVSDSTRSAMAIKHTLFAIFDDEEWRIITLFVNYLDSKTKYTDLFAASCGLIGDFTDIK